MKPFLPFATGLIGGALAYRWFQQPERREPVERFRRSVAERMTKHMERVFEAMPEDSPPKLIVSTLPRLEEQNEEVLTLLREQNELLRQSQVERDVSPIA